MFVRHRGCICRNKRQSVYLNTRELAPVFDGQRRAGFVRAFQKCHSPAGVVIDNDTLNHSDATEKGC